MIEINEEEEELIDNIGKETITFKRGDKVFSIKMNDIYCYGDIDLNKQDICDRISKFSFLSHLGFSGIPIYSNYDYETHTCLTSIKKLMWSETWNPLDLVRYAHACLNKPNKILLFSQIIK